MSPKQAADLVKPRYGPTAIRDFADKGWLRVSYTVGGHRRIHRDSIADLNTVLAMRPGPKRDAALDALRRRNLGEPEQGNPAG